MKFLCDAMLHGLARWLRAAGYDAKVCDKKASDLDVLNEALLEKRWLLTRDTHFLEMKEAKKCLVFLNHNSMSGCMHALVQTLDLDLLQNAFTRCLVCNTQFISIDPKKVTDEVPADVRAWQKHYFYCPTCDKVFWQASHTERMRKQLELWQNIK
jgi:uncharacterized protein